MLIWLVKISEPLPVEIGSIKGRTGMLAEALANRGHDVIWWTSSFDHQTKTQLYPDNKIIQLAPKITAITLKGIPYRKNFSLRRYVDHRIIAAKFERRAPQMTVPDLIVTAIPDYHLASKSVNYARNHNIPVIVDIRDPWPDVFLLHVRPPLKWLVKAALYFDFQKLKQTLRGADALTSTVSDWLDWGLQKTNRPGTWKDRVFPIGSSRSTPDGGDQIPESVRPILERVQGKFVVTFIGAFNNNYQPSVIVEAARLINSEPRLANEVAFILGGDGDLFATVKGQASGVNNIHFPGWLNGIEMAAIHSVSSIGIVPSAIPTEAFPNKAFNYLSAGLPVLSSNDGDLAVVLAESGAGMQFNRGDHEQLANMIKGLMNSPEKHQMMKANAKRIFQERFDSNIIYSRFVDYIQSVAEDSQLP